MRLGEMLVRDGRITEDQLQSAIDQQKRTGGRLGTVMVEIGLVDLDMLTVYLGLELGIPIASGAALERAKKLAVRLLSPEQAAHYRVVPLLIHDRQVIAAVDDPHDMQALDELRRITGYRIVPRVAPEIRIYYYLERYYGVARPSRFMVFGDSPRGNRRPVEDLPAPPLPGLPPVPTEKVTAPRPAPPLRTAPPPGAFDDDYEEIDLDDTDLLIELEADETAAAADAPPAEGGATGEAALPAIEDVTYEPIDLETAVAAMASAVDRNDIANTLMCHAASLFDVAALCIVRDGMAFGWKVQADHIDQDRIETLLIPLNMPSIFQSALANDEQLFAGAPFPATLHKHLFKVLRTAEPQYAVVAGVSIGRRIVNVVYGHSNSGLPLEMHDLTGLSRLCDAATAAYIRMIASSKKRRKAPAPDGDTPEAPAEEAAASDGDTGGAFDDESTLVGKRSARKSGEFETVGEMSSDESDAGDDA